MASPSPEVRALEVTYLKSPESTRFRKLTCARFERGDRPWDHLEEKEGVPLDQTFPGDFLLVLLIKTGPGNLPNNSILNLI